MPELLYEVVVRIASDSLLGVTILLSCAVALALAVLYWTAVGHRRLVAKCAIVAVLFHISLLLAVAQLPTVSARASEPKEISIPIELRAEDDQSGEQSLVDLERGLASPPPTPPEITNDNRATPAPIERERTPEPIPPAPAVVENQLEAKPADDPDLIVPDTKSDSIAAQTPREPVADSEVHPPSRPTEVIDRPEMDQTPLRTSIEPAPSPTATSIVPAEAASPPSIPLDVVAPSETPPPTVVPPPAPDDSNPTVAVETMAPRVDATVRPSPTERPSRSVDGDVVERAPPPPLPLPAATIVEATAPIVVARRDASSPIRPLDTPSPAPAPPKSSTDSADIASRFDLEEEVATRRDPVARPAAAIPSTDATKIDIAGLVARSKTPEPQVEAPPADRARFWENRTAPNRLEIVVQHGGSEETERAVSLALQWLATHQSDDGRWDSDGFSARCPDGDSCDGDAIENQSDAGLTGLSLLAFQGAGHTHRKASQYQETVRRGLSWLIRVQKPDGDLQVGGRIYAHSMATLALTEALAMTGDDRLKDPAQRAVLWLAKAQHEPSGGWRYGPNQFGDTSVFGWAVLALRSARSAGLDVPSVTWAQAERWIPTVSSGARGGLAAYRPGYPVSHAMTAETLFCRQVFGENLDPALVDEAADFVLSRLPDPDDYHLYYWYYGTLSMFQLGGDRWQRWNSRLTETLLATQRQSGHARGSWDPKRPFGVDGGRIFVTAASAMCLEVYYRYLPLYNDQPAVRN